MTDGSGDLDGLLDEGLAVEGSGWKEARGTAIRSREDTLRFYRKVAGWAAGRGWLRLAFLRLDGHPLAFDLAFEREGVHYLHKTGFDPAFRRYSPGLLLRHAMIARAYEMGLSRYEFLGADEPYKRRWADAYHERIEVRAFAPSPVGMAGWIGVDHLRPLLSRARRLARGRARA